MTVFAAASLSVAFPKFDGGQKYNFAGTDALAAQIRLGAPADVFAGASPDAPQALYRAGLVEQPVTFATNKLVLAVPASNPANITSIYDVERPGVKLLIGTATVPIGAYTRQVLNNMGITDNVLPQVVSQEQNVNAISSKVALGTADAGLHVRHRRAHCRRQGQDHPGSGLGAAARPLPDRDRQEHAEPRRCRGLHQATDEHGRTQAAHRQRIRRSEAAAEEEAAKKKKSRSSGR